MICTYVKAQSPYNQNKTYLYGYGAANIASLYQSSSNSSVEKFKAIWAPKIALAVRHEYAISKVGYEFGVQATEKGAKFSLTDQTVRLDYAQAYADFLLYFPLTHNNTFYCGGGFLEVTHSAVKLILPEAAIQLNSVINGRPSTQVCS